MSTSKNNQAGESTSKDNSTTSTHQQNGNNPSATSEKAGSESQSRQPQAAQGSAATTGRQSEKQSSKEQDGNENGLEAKAKAWLGQQQWLQNVDVNQLSKQAKDLGSKAVEQVNRLTPTQKVVGGALLVSGLSWLALRSSSNKSKAHSSSNDNEDTWQPSSESIYRGHKTDA